MLIRVTSHYKDNPYHVDKLINIEGLPEEWIFYRKDGKRFLKLPWEFDINANIPLDIRMSFQPEPMKIWTETPTEQRPGLVDPNLPKWIVDEHEVYGLRIDYQTGPGRDMWEQIEDLLDRETPRHLKIPKPAPVGDRMNWTLRADKVPSVVLKTVDELEDSKLAVPSVLNEVAAPARPEQFTCPECSDVFEKQRALWMHRRRKHKVSEPMKAVAA